MKRTVDLGWADDPIPEQFPELDREVAEQFDKDRMAINRLSVRGVLTVAQAESARKMLVEAICIVLLKTVVVARQADEGGET